MLQAIKSVGNPPKAALRLDFNSRWWDDKRMNLQRPLKKRPFLSWSSQRLSLIEFSFGDFRSSFWLKMWPRVKRHWWQIPCLRDALVRDSCALSDLRSVCWAAHFYPRQVPATASVHYCCLMLRDRPLSKALLAISISHFSRLICPGCCFFCWPPLRPLLRHQSPGWA